MEYNFDNDLRAIREILGLTQVELAQAIGVEQVTVSRNELGKTQPSFKLLEAVYQFAFTRGVRLNKLKEMLWQENIQPGHKLLFHGAKAELEGDISVVRGRKNNDFGQGFYTGESCDQAVSFVAEYEKSGVYLIDFDETDLKCKEYRVDREWMLTIAYYRGALDEYRDHPIVKKLAASSRKCDYIVAPIADNRMFRIIDSFIQGEITDEQCKHCLSATNLGNQYVLVSQKAAEHAHVVERCYICEAEKKYYRQVRSSDMKIGDDKVKLARSRYLGKGKYINQILC